MQGKGKHKFKVINGILSWRNEEMERFVPVPPEILTRVILLYENQFKEGIKIRELMEEQEKQGMKYNSEDSLYRELFTWMKELRGIFANIESPREKEKWMDKEINLN
jgi:hypothetical protein